MGHETRYIRIDYKCETEEDTLTLNGFVEALLCVIDGTTYNVQEVPHIGLKRTSAEQYKVITDNLEQQCKSAWMIVNHARNQEDISHETEYLAHGLINFLSDLGVPGYEMD